MTHWIMFVMLIFSASAFTADGWLALRGKAKIATEPLSDPVANGKPVTYLSIQGATAKGMYEGMQGYRSVENSCGEPGLFSRAVGNLICYRKQSSYSCELGVRLSDGAIRPGKSC